MTSSFLNDGKNEDGFRRDPSGLRLLGKQMPIFRFTGSFGLMVKLCGQVFDKILFGTYSMNKLVTIVDKP
jgi:hypothetical protein